MNKKAKSGAWVEVKYENRNRQVCWLTHFHPSMRKGSLLVDSFTLDFLQKFDDVIILNVKII